MVYGAFEARDPLCGFPESRPLHETCPDGVFRDLQGFRRVRVPFCPGFDRVGENAAVKVDESVGLPRSTLNRIERQVTLSERERVTWGMSRIRRNSHILVAILKERIIKARLS